MNTEGGFIIHARDGAYVCRPEKIDKFEDVMRSHFSRERRLAKGCFLVLGKPVDLAVGPQSVLCAVRLDGISLTTQFQQTGDKLYPVFGASGVMMSLEWKKPDDMELVFSSDCTKDRGRWRMGECFLFARKANKPGFLKLPLPNLYEDGRICMGNEVAGSIRGDTLEGCFKAALESFADTRWNSDLLPAAERTRALFRWTVDRKQIQPEMAWELQCRNFSRIEMEELCPQ